MKFPNFIQYTALTASNHFYSPNLTIISNQKTSPDFLHYLRYIVDDRLSKVQNRPCLPKYTVIHAFISYVLIVCAYIFIKQLLMATKTNNDLKQWEFLYNYLQIEPLMSKQ